MYTNYLFFSDITLAICYGGNGRKGCDNQQTKECWCIKGESGTGHWATKKDCNKSRYGKRPSPTENILTDRLCQTCSDGGVGKPCSKCTTVTMNSGDMLVLQGGKVVHGINKIIFNPNGHNNLPPRFNTKYRYSIQWRITSTKAKVDVIHGWIRGKLKEILNHVGFNGMIDIEARRKGYVPSGVESTVTDWTQRKKLSETVINSIIGNKADTMTNVDYLLALEMLLKTIMALEMQLSSANLGTSERNRFERGLCDTNESPRTEVLEREKGNNGSVFFVRRMANIAWSSKNFSGLTTSLQIMIPPDAPELLTAARLLRIESLCREMVGYTPPVCQRIRGDIRGDAKRKRSDGDGEAQPIDAATLQQVMEISGSDENTARSALIAAFGNAQRAIAYIFEPSSMPHQQQQQQQHQQQHHQQHQQQHHQLQGVNGAMSMQGLNNNGNDDTYQAFKGNGNVLGGGSGSSKKKSQQKNQEMICIDISDDEKDNDEDSKMNNGSGSSSSSSSSMSSSDLERIRKQKKQRLEALAKRGL